MQTLRLAGLARHARRYRAVPIRKIENLTERSAGGLFEIRAARGVDRVGIAATLDRREIEERPPSFISLERVREGRQMQ